MPPPRKVLVTLCATIVLAASCHLELLESHVDVPFKSSVLDHIYNTLDFELWHSTAPPKSCLWSAIVATIVNDKAGAPRIERDEDVHAKFRVTK